MTASAQVDLNPLPRNSSLSLPSELPGGQWQMENAFGSTRFNQPIGMAVAPGDNQSLFILERPGRIIKFDVPSGTGRTFMDISNRVNTGGEGGILGLAFHPDYQENRRFFVFYTLNASNGSGSGYHTRISRFERDPQNPDRAMGNSEAVLISQYNQASNHNGGDIHFGPDGYLYAALGDEGGANDTYQNSQRIDRDFFAGIIRIDVDEKPENLLPNPHPASVGNYRVPADNPYIGVEEFVNNPVNPDEIRTEFYAVGLRNPFRMSFDPLTGALYAGDVGQGAREEIDIIEKGGNYGWSYREGRIRGPRFSLFRDFIDPIYDYQHGSGPMEGRSVTGGVVYRGDRYPELFGKYVFSDYVSGNVWALESDGTQSRVTAGNIVRGMQNISGFGYDPTNGDILAARLNNGVIVRLTRQENTGSETIPHLLSQTGAFSDLSTLTPETGVYPYELNHPFWSDGAGKQRWFALPENSGEIAFESSRPFPRGSVWIKHFEMEMEEGNPESRRRLETRFIVKTADHVYGLTYRWNDQQTDAELVPEDGLTETLEIQRDGETVQQPWTYPSRSACLFCHSRPSGGVLGFSPHQLDRMVSWLDGEPVNQIDLLENGGMITPSEANHPKPSHLAVSMDDPDASTAAKVATYLHVNCAPCHQPGGPAVGTWDARITTPLWQKNILGADLVRTEVPGETALVEPGAPDASALLNRISTRGPRQMPPVASHRIDQQAVDLLREWITSPAVTTLDLPEQSWESWFRENFQTAPDGWSQASGDGDDDNTPEILEYLLDTDPNDPESGWTFSTSATSQSIRFEFPAIPQRGLNLTIQSSTSPSGPWELKTLVPDPLAPTIHEVETAESDRVFFRIVLSQPDY